MSLDKHKVTSRTMVQVYDLLDEGLYMRYLGIDLQIPYHLFVRATQA